MFLQIAALMLPTRIAARVGSSIADAGVYAAIEIADITRMRDGLSKVEPVPKGGVFGVVEDETGITWPAG